MHTYVSKPRGIAEKMRMTSATESEVEKIPYETQEDCFLMRIDGGIHEFVAIVCSISYRSQLLIASYSNKELEIIADFLTRFTNNVTEQTKKIEKVQPVNSSRWSGNQYARQTRKRRSIFGKRLRPV